MNARQALAGRSRLRRHSRRRLWAVKPTHIAIRHSLRRNQALGAKPLEQWKAGNGVYLLGRSAVNPWSGFYRATREPRSLEKWHGKLDTGSNVLSFPADGHEGPA